MLGRTLDYRLLRPLAHGAHRASEHELDAAFREAPAGSIEAALPKLEKILARFEGALELRPGLRYLDMGCGTGELTLALALRGAGEVTGVDILPRNVASSECPGPSRSAAVVATSPAAADGIAVDNRSVATETTAMQTRLPTRWRMSTSGGENQ